MSCPIFTTAEIAMQENTDLIFTRRNKFKIKNLYKIFILQGKDLYRNF